LGFLGLASSTSIDSTKGDETDADVPVAHTAEGSGRRGEASVEPGDMV
jgi:hypothetical protein